MFEELETVLIDEKKVEKLEFVSNRVYIKMSDSFWIETASKIVNKAPQILLLDAMDKEYPIHHNIYEFYPEVFGLGAKDCLNLQKILFLVQEINKKKALSLLK